MLKINRVEVEGKSITLDGNIKFDISKADLEAFALHEAGLQLPISIQDGNIEITKLDSISILPDRDAIKIDADFEIDHFIKRHHISLALENKMVAWATASALVRIVPNSVHVTIGDNSVTNWVARTFKYGDIDINTETALQSKLSEFATQARFKNFVPSAIKIDNFNLYYNSVKKKILASCDFTADFDKIALDSEIQANIMKLFSAYEFVPEGRSEGFDTQRVPQSRSKIQPRKQITDPPTLMSGQ